MSDPSVPLAEPAIIEYRTPNPATRVGGLTMLSYLGVLGCGLFAGLCISTLFAVLLSPNQQADILLMSVLFAGGSGGTIIAIAQLRFHRLWGCFFLGASGGMLFLSVIYRLFRELT